MNVDYTTMTTSRTKKYDDKFEIDCQILDTWTLLYDKSVNKYKFTVKVFGQLPEEQKKELIIDLKYEN